MKVATGKSSGNQGMDLKVGVRVLTLDLLRWFCLFGLPSDQRKLK